MSLSFFASKRTIFIGMKTSRKAPRSDLAQFRALFVAAFGGKRTAFVERAPSRRIKWAGYIT